MSEHNLQVAEAQQSYKWKVLYLVLHVYVCVCVCVYRRLFEDAASKLNLVGLVFFLQQLRKASQSQLFDSVTETGDYSLAMPGKYTRNILQTYTTQTQKHLG